MKMSSKISNKITIILLFCCYFFYSCFQSKNSSGNIHHKEITPLVATSLKLIKENCKCGSTSAFRYRIVYNDINDPEDAYCEYSYDPVIRASDSLKIQILSDLLEATRDTSLCCKSVVRYGNGDNSKEKPYSKTYNLQIDALFTFNFIAFGVNAKANAPYPVLYDTLTNMEINNDVGKIKEVVALIRIGIIGYL